MNSKNEYFVINLVNQRFNIISFSRIWAIHIVEKFYDKSFRHFFLDYLGWNAWANHNADEDLVTWLDV